MNLILGIRSFRLGPPMLLGLALVVHAGCSTPPAEPSAQGQTKEAGAAPGVVKTTTPIRKTMTRKIEQPGEVQAFEQTPVFAKIGGYVDKVHKDIGDRVKEGDLLAELSVPEMDEELGQKRALVVQARAEVEQAKKLLGAADADLKSTDAKVHEAESSRLRVNAEQRRAESQHKRFKGASAVLTSEVLDESGLSVEATRAAVAEVEAKIGSAEANRLAAEAKRDKARVDIQLAEARQKVAEADERRMAALVQYAKMRAPFAGVVTRRHVDPGHLLQPSAGPKGEPIFVVVRLDPVRISVDVPESDAVLVNNGVPALVTFQSLKGEQFKGTVTRTSWSLDSKERTLRAEIDLKNPEARLRPGMYAYSVLTVERPDVWTVPATAVMTQGDQSSCFLVREGKAVRTLLKVGFRDAQAIEVQKKLATDQKWEEFTGNEEVIAQPSSAVADGQAVQSVRETKPS